MDEALEHPPSFVGSSIRRYCNVEMISKELARFEARPTTLNRPAELLFIGNFRQIRTNANEQWHAQRRR